MLRIEMLGGLALTGDDGIPVVTQRRRLALLALVAASREQGMSRDKLIAYLWPESPPESARHSLEQLLYGLRRQLREPLFLDGNPLRLNPTVVWSDVTALEQSAARGALEDAARVYRGPFLDGFFLSGAPEFEHWVDSERRRMAELAASVLEKLALDARARGEPQRAVDWWRKRSALDSLSGRGALGLMRALVEAGDRSAALQHALAHETLLQQELESPPEPDVTAFVAELRAVRPVEGAPAHAARRRVGEQNGASALASLAQQPPPFELAEADASSLAGDEDRTPSRLVMPGPGAGRTPAARTTRLPAASAVLVALVLGVTWIYGMSAGADTSASALDPQRVVVLPFRVTGADSSLAYLREGMVDLLAAELTGEGGLLAVDSRTTLGAWRRLGPAGGDHQVRDEDAFRLARAVGAGQFLVGEVLRTSDAQLVLNGTLLSVPGRKVRARAQVRGRVDSLPALIDRLTAALLIQQAGEGEQHLAALSSTSLPALRAYLDGCSAYRRGHYAAAVAHLTRALELDSTFALGGLALASAAGFSFKLRPGDQAVGDEAWWTEADSAWRRGAEVAWKNQQQLSARDRTYLQAIRGTHYPSGTPALEQLANWERTVQAAPDRADAWYRFGLILLYQGPSVEVRDSRARAATAFRRALAVDSGFVAPLAGLLEVAAFARDTAEVRRLGARYLARDSSGETADYVRWRVATSVNDGAALRSLRARMHALSPESLGRIQWTSQADGIALDDAERALAELLRRAGSRVERARALGQARMLALNRGRPREALRLDDQMLDLQGRAYWNPAFRVVYALYWAGDAGAGGATVRRMEPSAAAALASGRATRAEQPGLLSQLLVSTLWRLRHGDTAAAGRTVELLRSSAPEAARFGGLRRADLHRVNVLEALVAAAASRPDAAALLNRLDSLTLQGCCETPHYANLVVARLREQQGDAAGALRAVRRGRWYFPPEYLSSTLRDEGRLAALTGDREGAMRAYRHFLALWSDPEPEMTSEVERVRAELTRLERQR
ncbi:MAG TPA: BTAD domain-containing putative transcriptional regulator [Gemmatimonadaceae bacterium]|nr:BTAD domain-containing putative transcriptional regulator [Gemmatimonadaceae bacterium]